MKFSCSFCRSALEVEDRYSGDEIECPVCGKKILCKESDAPKARVIREGGCQVGGKNGFASTAAGILGIKPLSHFKWGDLFSEVFRKHDSNAVEEHLMLGTEANTPDIFDIEAIWPKPWMFVRCLLMLIGLFVLNMLLGDGLRSTVPCFVIIGAAAVPLACALFFFELNIRKNVSIVYFMKLILVGGIMSPLILSFIGILEPMVIKTFNIPEEWCATLAGPMEETAKLCAVVLFARKLRHHYILNGLMFGAAVGVGFGIFETAGYVLGSGQGMLSTTIVRGISAPVGHVAYSSIWAGALWRVKGRNSFSFSMLKDKGFLKLFLFGISLHAFWNSPLLFESTGGVFGKILIVGISAYWVIFSLAQEGIEQIRKEQETILSDLKLG